VRSSTNEKKLSAAEARSAAQHWLAFFLDAIELSSVTFNEYYPNFLTEIEDYVSGKKNDVELRYISKCANDLLSNPNDFVDFKSRKLMPHRIVGRFANLPEYFLDMKKKQYGSSIEVMVSHLQSGIEVLKNNSVGLQELASKYWGTDPILNEDR
jgi:hypothetical protein